MCMFSSDNSHYFCIAEEQVRYRYKLKYFGEIASIIYQNWINEVIFLGMRVPGYKPSSKYAKGEGS